MANPQVEDGHTRIANELMEALCRTRIPGEARQVLDVIFRKTYGWHKKSDAISLSQFVEMTGLKKPHIAESLKKLLVMNIITEKGKAVTEKGNELGKVYEINKNYETWKPLPKKVTLPKKVKIVPEKGNASFPKKGTTKATTTKTKKASKPPQILDEEFWNQIKTLYHWVDVDREVNKMKAYQLTDRGKNWKMTKRSVVNWLNRIDKPLTLSSGQKGTPQEEELLRRIKDAN
jgi:phage replication O-like protein O